MANYCNISLYLSTTLCIATQNRSIGVNVVSRGSPSRMRIVRRISLGITTLPKSSILLTIPVAFIYKNSFKNKIVILLFVIKGNLYLVYLLFTECVLYYFSKKVFKRRKNYGYKRVSII